MELKMSGEVLKVETTRGGRAQRVLVATGSERNAVVIAPLGVKIGEELELFPVRANVQLTREGRPTTQVVFMAAEGWPVRARRGEGGEESWS